MALAAWIEQTWLAHFVRDVAWGFPFALILHAIGMGFVVGFGFALGARTLGVARGVRLVAFAEFVPVVRVNMALIIVSGVMLLAAFPARVLSNPIFYIKLMLLAVALVLTQRLCAMAAARRGAPAARRLAALTIACWIAVIVAGRLLPYTHDRFISSGG